MTRRSPDASAGAAPSAELTRLAERVRAALLERALDAHEDARLQGLCMEGAWEAAVSAIRSLDVSDLVQGSPESDGPGSSPPKGPPGA